MIENLAFKGKLVWFGLDWFSFVWFGFLSAGSLDYAGEEVCKIWLQLVEKLMRYDTKHSSSLSKNVLHSTYKLNFWHIERTGVLKKITFQDLRESRSRTVSFLLFYPFPT